MSPYSMSESMWSAVLRSPDSPVQKSSPATKRTSVFQEQSSFFFKRPGKQPVKARKDAGNATLHGLRQDHALAAEMRL